MEYLIGVLLALAVAGFAAAIGFDRCRAFYSTVLIVIGSYYVLFAAMGAPARALWVEIAFAGLVLAGAAIGFRKNLWLVAAMMAGHGIFDLFHASIIANPGVPQWWPGFCMTFDVVAGAWMAFLLRMRPELSGQIGQPEAHLGAGGQSRRVDDAAGI
jgi:hypothetical protein